MTSHRHPAGSSLYASGGAMGTEEAPLRCDPQFVKHLLQDLRDHQTVLTLASEALAQEKMSDRLIQQRLYRMQAAIAESHRLLETLLACAER